MSEQAPTGAAPAAPPGAVHLLATKLFVPRPRPDLITRPRLLDRLDAGLAGGRCTLLSAPAGAGKTSLLALDDYHLVRAGDPRGARLPARPPTARRSSRHRNALGPATAAAALTRELVVVQGTVKSHQVHLYGKLGVHSRTRAVAPARDLGLLD